MIVACEMRHLAERAMERGWLREEVEPCIVWRDGDNLRVDTSHPAYPAKTKRRTLPTAGPGTELKKILSHIGIVASEGCGCQKKALVMDYYGPDWCALNLDLLVGWLREEAEKRSLPFANVAGRVLVKEAIRRARKVAAHARSFET